MFLQVSVYCQEATVPVRARATDKHRGVHMWERNQFLGEISFAERAPEMREPHHRQRSPRNRTRPISLLCGVESADTHACASKSFVRGEGLQVHLMDVPPARFCIHACDRFARRLAYGGDAFQVSIRGPDLVHPSLLDCSDGTYRCEWQTRISGAYLISVLLDGEHILGSPFAAKAIQPRADPSRCRISPSKGEIASIAGRPVSFSIELFDCVGIGLAITQRELERVNITAEAIAYHRGGRSHGPILTALEMPDGTENLEEQTARVRATIDRAGLYSLHVLMDSNSTRQPLQGSPLTLRIDPAKPSAADTICDAKSGDCEMRAGEKRSFMVRTYDAYGNACKRGGASIVLRTRSVISTAIVDLENGCYQVTWRCEVAGRFDANLLLEGTPVPSGAALTLVVEPGNVSVRTSRLSGDLTLATAGERQVILMQAIDDYGNHVLQTSAHMSLGISLEDVENGRRVKMLREGDLPGVASPSAHSESSSAGAANSLSFATISGTWLNADSSTFKLVYTCSKAGSYVLRVWYCDEAGGVLELPSSPHRLRVVHANADGRGSAILKRIVGTVVPKHNGFIAGDKLRVHFQIRDRLGNVCDPKHGELRVSLDGPQGREQIQPTLVREILKDISGTTTTTIGPKPGHGGHDHGPGLFEVEEELYLTGPYELNVTVLGRHIRGSPLNLGVVRAAPPEFAQWTLIAPTVAPTTHQPICFVMKPNDGCASKDPTSRTLSLLASPRLLSHPSL